MFKGRRPIERCNMKTAVLAIALLTVQQLFAAELRGNAIILTPQEMQQCAESGGCSVITHAALAEMQMMMRSMAMQMGTCRKGEGA